ncbi:hypothetical protein ACHAQD_010953 [Fusarium lateritium]
MSSTTEQIMEWLGAVNMNDNPRVVWVDTEAAISELVYTLDCYRRDSPAIFIDIREVGRSRKRTISVIQLYDAVEHVAYLIDVLTLGEKCFTAPAKDDWTLKDILEDKGIRKVFFDVREDSHALYTHHDIVLGGVHDLQLMELATRSHCRGYVSDLSTCIRREASTSEEDMSSWTEIEEKSLQLFGPKWGDSEIFNQRPLPEDIRLRCAQNVQLLSHLYTRYRSRLTPEWKRSMVSASADRVQLSQSADFNGRGIYMAVAPKGWHEIEDCPGALVRFYPGPVI